MLIMTMKSACAHLQLNICLFKSFWKVHIVLSLLYFETQKGLIITAPPLKKRSTPKYGCMSCMENKEENIINSYLWFTR